LLLAQEDRIRVDNFDLGAVGNSFGGGLQYQVNLVRRAPYSQHWVGRLVRHPHDEACVPPSHRIFAIRRDAQELGSLVREHSVESLDGELENAESSVADEHWEDNEMQVDQHALIANTKAHVEE
jgi:hypothetical protein